ncbi:MAG: integrase [Burkholderiales bacterium]|nr:integrase [Burkholderiales bacterium]
MANLSQPKRPRAHELLARQPLSLAGLSSIERDRIVVTAVCDADGNEHPLTHFGDMVWDMAPDIDVKNLSSFNCRITWARDVPKALTDDAKAVLYCALRRGRQDRKPWSGSAVLRTGRDSALLLRHIASLGIKNFGQIRALHMSDHIAELRRRLKPKSVCNRLTVIDLVWHFPLEVGFPLPQDPWSGQSLPQACGCNDDDGGPSGRTGKTPVIPRAIQRQIFEHCEAQLAEAGELLRARDAGKISAGAYALTAVRDAVLFLLQITSGMRNSESTGTTNNCWRSEIKDGIAYHWVRTNVIKGGRGLLDFLIPPEAISSLEFLQKYAMPLQARLASEARWLEKVLAEAPAGCEGGHRLSNGLTTAEVVLRLNRVREIGTCLFLCISKSGVSDHMGNGERVDVMTAASCNNQLKALARAAGTDWKLANHQCRRTFSYNVANSRLGRMGLVFLKWQLKHASLSWTQLYASNPYQDHSLYREMEDEQIQARIDLMEGWLQPGAPLSGGAGKKLMQTRAVPVKDINDLVGHTAEAVDIRSTGHAWCLSGTRGCNGQGVYDPSMCGGCSQAVIDADQGETWQMIHMDNLRLAAIADCGDAVSQKAERSIRRSEQVLRDLGVPVPSQAQADAYMAASS